MDFYKIRSKKISIFYLLMIVEIVDKMHPEGSSSCEKYNVLKTISLNVQSSYLTMRVVAELFLPKDIIPQYQIIKPGGKKAANSIHG